MRTPINKQTYDVRTLAKALVANHNARIPHSRRTPDRTQMLKIHRHLRKRYPDQAEHFFHHQNLYDRSFRTRWDRPATHWASILSGMLFDITRNSIQNSPYKNVKNVKIQKMKAGDMLVLVNRENFGRINPNHSAYITLPHSRPAIIKEPTIGGLLDAARDAVAELGPHLHVYLEPVEEEPFLRRVAPERVWSEYIPPGQRVWKLGVVLTTGPPNTRYLQYRR